GEPREVGERASRLQRRMACLVHPIKTVGEGWTARSGRAAELSDRGRRPAEFADCHALWAPGPIAALQHSDETMTSSTYMTHVGEALPPQKRRVSCVRRGKPGSVAALQQGAFAASASEKQQEADHPAGEKHDVNGKRLHHQVGA